MSVTVEPGAGFVRLTLNDPDRRNPLSRAMLAELTAAIRDHTPDAGALIIAGAGGVFSAGADLRELTGTAADTEVDDAVASAGATMRATDALVLAAVAGPCLGAAFDLVLNADVIVAEQSAYFQVPAVRLGLLYNPGAIARWHRVLPVPLLRRLLLTGERLDAETAHGAGLVAEVVPDGTAAAAAGRQAAVYAEAPAAAAAATKELLRDLDEGGYDPRRWHETRLLLLDAPERRAALAARTTRRTT